MEKTQKAIKKLPKCYVNTSEPETYKNGFDDFDSRHFEHARFDIDKKNIGAPILKGFLYLRLNAYKNVIGLGSLKDEFEKITYDSINRDSNKTYIGTGDSSVIVFESEYHMYEIEKINEDDTFVLKIYRNNSDKPQ